MSAAPCLRVASIVLLATLLGCGKPARGPMLKGKGSTTTGTATLDPLPAPQTPPDKMVAGLMVSTSFVDTGIKALVLSDGTAYTYNLGQQPKFQQFQLTEAQHSQLAAAFEHHHFLGFPPEMRNPVTDGTDVVVMYANDKEHHQVLNYMFENADFAALQQRFAQVIAEGRQNAQTITAAELLAAVEAQLETMPAKSPRRQVVEDWLTRSRGSLRAHQVIPGDNKDQQLIPKQALPQTPSQVKKPLRES